MENRDFKGVWIPKEIYLHKELSWSEKILLIEIDSLDNDEEKGCFASNKYLAEFIGISESSMANMISKLKAQKYIFQVFFDGRNRGLRLHKNMKSDFIEQHQNEVCLHKNMNPALIKTLKQTTQKNEHSNTINNTDNKSSKKPQTLESYLEKNKAELGLIFADYPAIKEKAIKWLKYKFEKKEGYKETGWAKIMVKRIKESSLDFIKKKIDETIDNETGNKDYVYQNQIDAFKKMSAQTSLIPTGQKEFRRD